MNSETSAEGPLSHGDRRSGGGSGGAVRTFLIADVRGFTRFTQEQGDEAASELAARSARIVSDEVPEFEGELLEVRGDPRGGGAATRPTNRLPAETFRYSNRVVVQRR